MDMNTYEDIKSALRQLYIEDDRPWLVGFSGGKDSTMLASLIFETVLSFPIVKTNKTHLHPLHRYQGQNPHP